MPTVPWQFKSVHTLANNHFIRYTTIINVSIILYACCGFPDSNRLRISSFVLFLSIPSRYYYYYFRIALTMRMVRASISTKTRLCKDTTLTVVAFNFSDLVAQFNGWRVLIQQSIQMFIMNDIRFFSSSLDFQGKLKTEYIL